MRTVSDLLLELLASGLTQTEITKRTGIPQPRLSRWASGAAPDSADDALKLYALREEVVLAPKAPAPPLASEPVGHEASHVD